MCSVMRIGEMVHTDLPDGTEDEIREVYARYGLAMYQAQCLERGLATALSTAFRLGPQRITKDEWVRLESEGLESTLGRLLARLRTAVTVAQGLDESLKLASQAHS